MEELKASKQPLGAEAIWSLNDWFRDFAPPLLLRPTATINFSTRLFNMLVTNFPGPQMPFYVLGRELVGVYPVGFLARGHALAIAIFSYNGQIFFGLIADRDSVADLEAISSYVDDAFEELYEAARDSLPQRCQRAGTRSSTWGRGETASASGPETEEERRGVFRRLRESLSKSRQALTEEISASLFDRIDDETWERLEEALILADAGAPTTAAIVERLEHEVEGGAVPADGEAVRRRLIEILAEVASTGRAPLDLGSEPAVLLMVGVNGTGKTTTIGKIAWHHLGGSSASRWCSPPPTPTAPPPPSSSPSGPIAPAPNWSAPSPAAIRAPSPSTRSRRRAPASADVVIVDTAGRLHTQGNLMDELAKVRRVIGKQLPDAPHETLISIDATTGQNGLAPGEGLLRRGRGRRRRPDQARRDREGRDRAGDRQRARDPREADRHRREARGPAPVRPHRLRRGPSGRVAPPKLVCPCSTSSQTGFRRRSPRSARAASSTSPTSTPRCARSASPCSRPTSTSRSSKRSPRS